MGVQQVWNELSKAALTLIPPMFRSIKGRRLFMEQLRWNKLAKQRRLPDSWWTVGQSSRHCLSDELCGIVPYHNTLPAP